MCLCVSLTFRQTPSAIPFCSVTTHKTVRSVSQTNPRTYLAANPLHNSGHCMTSARKCLLHIKLINFRFDCVTCLHTCNRPRIKNVPDRQTDTAFCQAVVRQLKIFSNVQVACDL